MRRVLFLLLLLYTALLPFERVWRILLGQDSILKPYRIVALLTVALWAMWLLFSGRRLTLDIGDKSYLVIFAWGVLMAYFWDAVYGNDIGYTTHAVQLIAFGLAMYVFTKKLALGIREIASVFAAYTLGLTASALWAFQLDETPGARFRGLQNNPNQLGVAAGICLIVLIAQFLYTHRPRLLWQFVRGGTALAMLALIGLSGSRGALIGTMVGVVVALFIAPRSAIGARPGFARLLRIGLFAGLCGAALYAGYDRFEAAWDQTDSRVRFREEYAVETASERWDLWRSGWSVGVDHFGLGAGMMQYLTHHVATIRSLDGISSQALMRSNFGTHSDYIDLFACYGLVGLTGYAIYVGALLRQLWRRYSSTSDNEDGAHLAPLGLALLAAMLVFEISMNCFTWCDYFMVMAIVHTIAWPVPAPHGRTVALPVTGRETLAGARPALAARVAVTSSR